MKNTLKDWCWCIDYSEAVEQKDARIAPIICFSRIEARRINSQLVPVGVIRKIRITAIKAK